MNNSTTIIKNWCAAAGMPEPSDGECHALEVALNQPSGNAGELSRDLLIRVSDALGRFVSDEGWQQEDMDLADELSAALSMGGDQTDQNNAEHGIDTGFGGGDQKSGNAGWLPPLPEPEMSTDEFSVGGVAVDYYNCDHMRDYARAALAAQSTQPDWHRIADERAAEIVRLDGLLAAQAIGQDREDADRLEWMADDNRAPWAINSLKDRIKEMRASEKRCRNAFRKDYMRVVSTYFAEAIGEAAQVLEKRLAVIESARAAAGTKKQ